MKWLVATLVEKIFETSTACTLIYDVDGWPGHQPGQHIDVRLTAEDGYSAQRSYSLAQPSDGDRIALTVQSVADGEVSPYLTSTLEVGEQIEIRGPIGGWFVWNEARQSPVLLLAGGSGIVPLMAMMRARSRSARKIPFLLIYSVRSPADLIYARELRSLPEGIDVGYRFTRKAPPEHDGRVGRLTAQDLESGGWEPDSSPDCFVCGPTGFVESAADMLVEIGHAPYRIRTERFGTT
ncbi:ferredoxin reductase [Rhodococcus sp. H29-C3]|uniref:ferredoxin reductase n=1 Tax=Rhodococcus sp. H29-C3 TaxID=3046307 RepID=UPI0024BBDF9C|nr:ferredoxin reductase [Rhodococcus sp. H29-C3]MDJ0360448.1 ferredoxin reductase [Rhodococcus sp. H29-C3]